MPSNDTEQKPDHRMGIGGNIWEVSKNRGTPKWMVMENPLEIDDLGVPLFQETSIWYKKKEYDLKKSWIWASIT